MPAKTAERAMSFRPKAETLAKIRKIAETNGLSIADVMNLALAGGVNIVETKLAEIRDKPEAAAAAAHAGGDAR